MGRDVMLWRHDEGTFKDHFPAARTWDQIGVRGHQVSWQRLVWFAQGVPRHTFIVLLAFKNSSPQVFLSGSGGSHKVVCSVERRKKVETICSFLVLSHSPYGLH